MEITDFQGAIGLNFGGFDIQDPRVKEFAGAHVFHNAFDTRFEKFLSDLGYTKVRGESWFYIGNF